MPKGILRYLAAGALVLGTLVAVPVTAAQAETPTSPIEGCHSSEWYVNDDGDETARKPEQTEDGLKFVGNDLVHHAPVPATIELQNLHPGTFVATPAPSLSSFFSVEIANPDGTGYATLRYDTADNKWNIGGTSTREANPLDIIGKANRKGQTILATSRVLSFGVGYVANPANGTETLVKSVTFAGRTYDLTCPFVKSTIAITKACRVSKTDKRTRWTVVVGGPRNREVWAWIWSPNPHPGQNAKGFYHLPNGKGSYQLKVGANVITSGWGGGLAVHAYDGKGNRIKAWATSNAKNLC